MGVLRIGLVLVACAAVAIVANVVLLGVAAGGDQPVGRLSPRGAAAVVAPAVSPPAPRPAVPPVRHGHDSEEGAGADD